MGSLSVTYILNNFLRSGFRATKHFTLEDLNSLGSVIVELSNPIGFTELLCACEENNLGSSYNLRNFNIIRVLNFAPEGTINVFHKQRPRLFKNIFLHLKIICDLQEDHKKLNSI
jgi:hypothetical protein